MFNEPSVRTNGGGAKKIGAKAPIYLGPRLRGGDVVLVAYFSNFFIHADSWCGRRPS
jgi:hypothetical protein